MSKYCRNYRVIKICMTYIHLIYSQSPQDDVVLYTAKDIDCPVPDISYRILKLEDGLRFHVQLYPQ